MEKLRPAIVISSSTMGLGVIRALGKKRVPIIAVTYDERDVGYVSKFVIDRVKVPHPEQFEDQFVENLISISSVYDQGVLIPASDASLAVVARNKKLLEANYIVACPEWEITQKFIEKRYSYELADLIGVPAPKTFYPKSLEDLENYSESLEFPFLLKPVQSHLFTAHFKQKMFRIENSDQLITTFQKSMDANLDVMLQEIIPGGDENGVNYNSYFFDGQPLVEFTAIKIRNGPPDIGSPRVAKSMDIPEIIEPGRKILDAMGFYGFACTEFKKDARDGRYVLMEINGRHNLSSLLAVRCGINFPWLHYNHLANGEIPGASEFQSGIYWIDIPRDIGYSLKYRKSENYSIFQYLRPYFGPRVFAILDFLDLRPFVWKIILEIKNIFN